MIKMYWEGLPKGLRNGKECVGWKNCIGLRCNFEYYDVFGEVEIINYDKKNDKLGIKYLDKDIFYIQTNSFKKCQIGVLIGKIKKRAYV